MPRYSVAQASNALPRLIKNAIAGEEVIITRHGKPVADLRSIAPVAADSRAATEWLIARTDARPQLSLLPPGSFRDWLYDDYPY